MATRKKPIESAPRQSDDPLVCVCTRQNDSGAIQCPKSCLLRWSLTHEQSHGTT